MFKSKNYEGAECVLEMVDTGAPVKIGDVFTDRFGDTWIIDGGSAPHNAASTGRVYVTHHEDKFQRTFYPQVFGMHWRPL